MSRTPASYTLQVVRGATWEDSFAYKEPDNTPFDLTGFSARMQVRTLEGQYGLSAAETLVMELAIGNGLEIELPETGVVALLVSAAQTVVLNPGNLKKVALCYSLELFRQDGNTPEYVIPLVKGKITVSGETTR